MSRHNDVISRDGRGIVPRFQIAEYLPPGRRSWVESDHNLRFDHGPVMIVLESEKDDRWPKSASTWQCWGRGEVGLSAMTSQYLYVRRGTINNVGGDVEIST